MSPKPPSRSKPKTESRREASRRRESELEALARAQDMVFEAWEAGTKARCVALAKKAIAVSPLCADAFNILAEASPAGSDEELDYWRQAVEAGRQAIGDEFEEMTGFFWGVLETRPFMRAKLGLAQALWERGERETALAHLQEMLRLNPNDNQGVRDLLAGRLAELGRDEALSELLAQYPDDDSATFAWTRALLAFRREGDKEASRRRLAEAIDANSHVPAFLLGDKKLPKSPPAFYSIGGKDEAVIYCQDLAGGWPATPGALDWLRAGATRKPAKAKRRAK